MSALLVMAFAVIIVTAGIVGYQMARDPWSNQSLGFTLGLIVQLIVVIAHVSES